MKKFNLKVDVKDPKIYLSAGGLLLFILILASILFFSISPDNPKTQNVLLQNKLISWTYDRAGQYEFHANGILVAIGGEYPLEGYRGMRWESLTDNGSFKILQDPQAPRDFFVAIFRQQIAQGQEFQVKQYVDGKAVEPERKKQKILYYKDMESSRIAVAVGEEAKLVLTRYAGDIYTLEPILIDRFKVVKGVELNGAPFSGEKLALNGDKWGNTPPLVLSKETLPPYPFTVDMTISYQNDQTREIHFQIEQYRDRSSTFFDDPWF